MIEGISDLRTAIGNIKALQEENKKIKKNYKLEILSLQNEVKQMASIKSIYEEKYLEAIRKYQNMEKNINESHLCNGLKIEILQLISVNIELRETIKLALEENKNLKSSLKELEIKSNSYIETIAKMQDENSKLTKITEIPFGHCSKKFTKSCSSRSIERLTSHLFSPIRKNKDFFPKEPKANFLNSSTISSISNYHPSFLRKKRNANSLKFSN